MSEWLAAYGYLLIPLALVLAVTLVLWRVWPVLKGTARRGDDPQARLARWNRYLMPLFRKTLDGKMLVAGAGFVGPEGEQRTIATWTLEPSVLPDVDFVALARPGTADDPEVQAVADAADLRALLSGFVQEQTMFGHTAWIHIWPPEADIDALVEKLTPVAQFRAQMGIAEPPAETPAEGEAS